MDVRGSSSSTERMEVILMAQSIFLEKWRSTRSAFPIRMEFIHLSYLVYSLGFLLNASLFLDVQIIAEVLNDSFHL